jgi:hypothetical protein
MKVETIRSIGGILIGSASILLIAANLVITDAAPAGSALSPGGYIIATSTPSLPQVEQPQVGQLGQVEPSATALPQVEPSATALPQVEQPQVGQLGQLGQVGDSAPVGQVEQPPVEQPPVEQPPVEQLGQVEQPQLNPMCATGNTDPYCNLPVLTLTNNAPADSNSFPTMTAEQQAYSKRRTR